MNSALTFRSTRDLRRITKTYPDQVDFLPCILQKILLLFCRQIIMRLKNNLEVNMFLTEYISDCWSMKREGGVIIYVTLMRSEFTATREVVKTLFQLSLVFARNKCLMGVLTIQRKSFESIWPNTQKLKSKILYSLCKHEWCRTAYRFEFQHIFRGYAWHGLTVVLFLILSETFLRGIF